VIYKNDSFSMVIGHGIHNVASFSAKSGFRFASPGRSTRLFSLPPGLSLRFVLPLYPRLNEDTRSRSARLSQMQMSTTSPFPLVQVLISCFFFVVLVVVIAREERNE
jgi:hypothetical protein